MLFDPATGQGGARRVRPDEARRLRRRRSSPRRPTSSSATSYEDERDAALLPRQGLGGGLQAASRSKLPGKDDQPRLVDRATSGSGSSPPTSDTDPGERYLFDRDDEEADAPVHASASSIPREHLAAMKPIRYPSSDGLEIPAYLTLPKGVPAKNLPADRLPARRPVGPRRLGLQQPRAVPRQPRLRRAAAQLPRLHRLRQEVPQRRQQAVGREDAGRHHLGRQAPRRRRASPTRSGSAIMGGSYGGYATLAGRRLHARPLRRRRRRSSARRTSSRCSRPIPPYWEAGPDHLPRAHGQPDDARGQERARAAVAAQLRRRRSRRRSSSCRARTTRA